MADILHQITLEASADRVYEALTRAQGLACWWTPDVQVRGDVAEFGFDDHQVVFRMRIDTLEPRRRVEWSCEGDVAEWTGTRLCFDIDDQGERVILRFTHAGWRSTEGAFPLCNTDWGRLMYSLKDHVEGRDSTPFMA